MQAFLEQSVSLLASMPVALFGGDEWAEDAAANAPLDISDL
jgi:hypothetical protein